MNPITKFIGQAIGTVSPRLAMKWAQAGKMMAFYGGNSWHGASLTRAGLAGYRPSNGDADADTLWDLPELRRRSRDMARNIPIAGGAINTNVTNVVGTGLAFQSAIDADFLGLTDEQAEAWQDNVTRRYRYWAESLDCDITRQQNFYGLQSLVYRSVLESGDIGCMTPVVNVPGLGEMLVVQTIEADRISNPWNMADRMGRIAGVETSSFLSPDAPDTGAPVAYWVCNQHPGTRVIPQTLRRWDRFEAFGPRTGRRNFIHVFERLRPAQTRGIPYLSPVMEPLKQLGRYTDAEVAAAVNSAFLAIFTKMDPDAFGDLFDDNGKSTYLQNSMKWDGSFQPGISDSPGKAINLLPGEEIQVPNMGRPNDKFDPFVMAVLRQIGMRLELPFEVLVKHFQSSYSAARAALLDAWKFFKVRREFLATHFCQPVFENWLAYEIASGRVAAPGFFADRMIAQAYCGGVWIGDGPGSIDPYKEVMAAKERIDLGISTKDAESQAYDGIPYRTKIRQRAREQREEKAASLVQSPPDSLSNQDPMPPAP